MCNTVQLELEYKRGLKIIKFTFFAVKIGGMGAALLSKPDKVLDILTKLKEIFVIF